MLIVVSLAYFFPTKLHERPCEAYGHDETTDKCKSVVKREIFLVLIPAYFKID
jgi:hypothetical protein